MPRSVFLNCALAVATLGLAGCSWFADASIDGTHQGSLSTPHPTPPVSLSSDAVAESPALAQAGADVSLAADAGYRIISPESAADAQFRPYASLAPFPVMSFTQPGSADFTATAVPHGVVPPTPAYPAGQLFAAAAAIAPVPGVAVSPAALDAVVTPSFPQHRSLPPENILAGPAVPLDCPVADGFAGVAVPGRAVHRVVPRRGDTWSHYRHRFGATYAQLAGLNGLPVSVVRAGRSLWAGVAVFVPGAAC